MKYIIPIWALMISALLIPPIPLLHGNDTPPSLTGYLKSTMMVQQFAKNTVLPPLEEDKSYSMFQSQLRMRLFHEPSDVFSFEIAYAISPTAAKPSLITSQGFLNPRENTWRMYDLDEKLREDTPRDLSLLQNLDRCNINFFFPSADLHLGRQAIAFGSGKFINPTDIFSPFLFQDLNKEHKTGVDALRMTIPTGDFNEIDLGVVFGKDGKMDNNAVFMRTRIYLFNTDFSLMIMDFKNNIMLGFDMTRSISQAGFWLEAAHVFAGQLDSPNKDEDYFRLVSGFDFSFPDNTYLFVEYHYNTPGTDAKNKYISHTMGTINPFTGKAPLKTAYAHGGTYLMGRHYLIPGITYEFTPLVTGTLHSLINLTDLSSYMGARVEYGLRQDLFLEAGGFLAMGESADMEETGPIPHSEFGLYSNMIYAGLRFYF